MTVTIGKETYETWEDIEKGLFSEEEMAEIDKEVTRISSEMDKRQAAAVDAGYRKQYGCVPYAAREGIML
ncbi:MAG: hypothetical protein Q4E34_06375 [Synergistaceae bacterium]|nr:hypothetical protein [Synergistaceae bacterium]